jgi:hypothetical protein
LPSDELRIGDWRLMNYGFVMVEWDESHSPNQQSNRLSTIGNGIANLQSQSSVANLQSVNRQSAVANRQSDY